MEPRITLITLGVSDLARSLEFYRDGLRLPVDAALDEVVFFQLAGGLRLGLWLREELAKDAGLPDTSSGFEAISLAHNVRSSAEVDRVLGEAVGAGATLLKPGQHTEWGGYSGYFADPDGHLWEVAWNPQWEID